MIAITVALFEVLFVFYMKEYYHGIARTYLQQPVDNISAVNFTSFEDAINDILERENVNKDINLGIQIINKNKEVLVDQYGIKTGEKINYDDVNNALMGNEGYNIFTYNILRTKDHVMSISVPIKVGNSIEGVVRYSISLNEVDSVMIRMGIGIFIGGILILLICFLLSLRFADSLIKPIQDLKKTANKLAQGNYNITLSNEKLHDDEIGDLVRTFDHMAREIDKTRKLK